MIFSNKIEESLTLKFSQAANERRKMGLPIISLGLGEPDFDVPAPFIEAVVDVLRSSTSKYSDPMGIPLLRERISTKLSFENNIKCAPENIVVTAGAKQAFELICMSLLEPGDEVIIINPSFVSYIPQVFIAEPNSKVKVIDIDKKDFSIDSDLIRSAVSKRTKLIVTNSPNNPTGYVLKESFLSELFKLSQEYGFYIISDEVYEKLIFSDSSHFSIGSFENEPERVITVNGFSKSHSMTGWRLGYACFPKSLKTKVLKLQQHINTNTCTFIQEAVAKAFNCDQQYLIDYNARLRERVKIITHWLSGMKNVSFIEPEAGFFVFMNVGSTGIDSNTFCSELIVQKGVAATPGIAFGASWDDHVRISYAVAEDNLIKGMTLIKQYLENSVQI